MNINAMVTNLLSDWRAILLAWILINLLIYVAVGTVIVYIWDRKNMKAILDDDPAFKKRMKDIYPYLKDDEIARVIPSVPMAAFVAAGGIGVKYVKRYFIDGPHIDDPRPGIRGILGKNNFDFAVMLTANRGGIVVEHPCLYMLAGVIFLSAPIFWGLIPYMVAIVGHYDRIFSFVSRFGKDPGVTSALYKREDGELWKSDILRLQEYIEETIRRMRNN